MANYGIQGNNLLKDGEVVAALASPSEKASEMQNALIFFWRKWGDVSGMLAERIKHVEALKETVKEQEERIGDLDARIRLLKSTIAEYRDNITTKAGEIVGLKREIRRYQAANIAPHPAEPVPQQDDPVNNPKHYQFAPGIEAIDVIEAILTTEQFRGYLIGNALKYRLRAGDKGDTVQDINKSKWYQNRARSL